jgi:hypothetical protein
MCHEKHHRDPDLVAVANAICGVPFATVPSTREYSLTAARLLLDVASCVGLQEYLHDNPTGLASGDVYRFQARILAIRQRLASDAMVALERAQEDTPF